MWRLFATLYALIVVFTLVVDVVYDKYLYGFHHEALMEDQSRDTLSWLRALEHFAGKASIAELEDVFSKANDQANWPIEVLSFAQFQHRYPESESRFNEYGLLFLDVDESELLYRMEGQQAVLKFGPMRTIPELEELVARIDYIVYFFLAVVIFFWQINLWRKLVGLEQQVVAFGEGNTSARASERAGVRVGKLNAVFNGMAEKTSRLLLQNKELIRAVSHELRAPISRLRCQVDLLDVDGARSRDALYLNDMSDDITELENLVDEILHYSRLESIGNIVDVEQRKLKPVLIDLLAIMNRELSRDVLLACDNDVRAGIEELHLRRVVRNLVQNAARYCVDVVELSVERDHTAVLVHVDDDGPGIPIEERDRVFEPFARLDQSRTRDSGGYGLGLSIVAQIARLYAGEIRVSTSPAGGARITLMLPRNNAWRGSV